MPRVARKHIVSPQGGYFHVVNRICGFPGYYPLQRPNITTEFIRRLKHSLTQACIRCAGFVLMGNHFHLVLSVDPFRELSKAQLESFARARWGKLWKLRTRFWSHRRWQQFHHDLFDLSIFMRDLQGPFTTWFNKLTGRRGRLWAERFKCLALGEGSAIQEELLYVELNPIRARLCARPEQWRGGSAYLRAIGEDDFLIPLAELFSDIEPDRREDYYRALLLHRGMNPRRADQAEIPLEVVASELRRGFGRVGLYRHRCRGMTDGLMLGDENYIRGQLDRLTLEGVFKRNRKPTSQLGGLLFTAREQRSHCRW